MPHRKFIHATGEIYHVFNRGIARMPIFSSSNNYVRFMKLIDYYRFANTPTSFSSFNNSPNEHKKLILERLRKEYKLNVQILAFCLMNNHFHLLLRQGSNNGIPRFVSNIQNGYAKYYNVKNNRTGPLFQPMFKSVRVETDEQLLHVSRYIHLNPTTSYITSIEKLNDYTWSSLNCYTNNDDEYSFINTDLVLRLIKKGKYLKFVLDQVDYQRKLDKIRHLILE